MHWSRSRSPPPPPPAARGCVGRIAQEFLSCAVSISHPGWWTRRTSGSGGRKRPRIGLWRGPRKTKNNASEMRSWRRAGLLSKHSFKKGTRVPELLVPQLSQISFWRCIFFLAFALDQENAEKLTFSFSFPRNLPIFHPVLLRPFSRYILDS